MAKTAVLAATGPIDVVVAGQQVSLAVSALQFVDGKLTASGNLYRSPQKP